MSPTYALPDLPSVRRLLTTLFGKTVTVKKSAAIPDDGRSPKVIGIYRDHEGALCAACVCDLSFAAFAGCALSMLPAGAAEDTIKAGRLEETTSENAYEVLNICVGFFNGGEAPPIRLDGFHVSPPAFPDDISAFIQSDASRLDLEITFPTYGVGRLSLRAA